MILFNLIEGHEMQDCQGTARPQEGDEYKVSPEISNII